MKISLQQLAAFTTNKIYLNIALDMLFLLSHYLFEFKITFTII